MKQFKSQLFESLLNLNASQQKIYELLKTAKISDIPFLFGKHSYSNGWKLSLQGKSIEDTIELFSKLEQFLSLQSIDFKVATHKRINHSNKEQSHKVLTIYVPDHINVENLAESVYSLTKDYKGWQNIKTPTSYEHYAGCVFIRNDRDEHGNYIKSNQMKSLKEQLKSVNDITLKQFNKNIELLKSISIENDKFKSYNVLNSNIKCSVSIKHNDLLANALVNSVIQIKNIVTFSLDEKINKYKLSSHEMSSIDDQLKEELKNFNLINKTNFKLYTHMWGTWTLV